LRVQLRLGHRTTAAAALAIALFAPSPAPAQVVEADTAHTIYYENPTKTNMFVYSPSADLQARPWEWLAVRGGWEADIVSGASVAVKAGPAYARSQPAADVITTASVKDVRNVGRWGLTVKKDAVTFDGGYSYSTENDYKSHTFNVSARTELFEHNTQLQIDYARNFDMVCDRVQSAQDPPSRHRALEDSRGCWTGGKDPLRTTRGVAIDNFQGTWSQAWTPVFQTQLIYTLQVANGFQSNPYRAVMLGQGTKAQEHHPENRSRQSFALRGALFLRPLKAALRLGLRGYWDTWDVTSGTVELDFEKYVTERLRLTLRGRVYKQTGALFWSDDYTGGDPPLGPKGQYWTGDRELSPFYSIAGGARMSYAVATNDKGKVLGFLQALRLGAAFDLLHFEYESYTLGIDAQGQPIGVGNANAFIIGLNLNAAF
jgi:hypothetical protein